MLQEVPTQGSIVKRLAPQETIKEGFIWENSLSNSFFKKLKKIIIIITWLLNNERTPQRIYKHIQYILCVKFGLSEKCANSQPINKNTSTLTLYLFFENVSTSNTKKLQTNKIL